MGAVTPGRLVRRGTGETDRGYDVGGGRLRLVIWRNYFEDGPGLAPATRGEGYRRSAFPENINLSGIWTERC